MKKIIPIVAIWTLLLTSCSSANIAAPVEIIPQNLTSLDSFYSQELVWDNCKDDKKFQCAEIQVPGD